MSSPTIRPCRVLAPLIGSLSFPVNRGGFFVRCRSRTLPGGTRDES
jgi:hypothetical protein